jgi:RHS repeat-associated protein
MNSSNELTADSNASYTYDNNGNTTGKTDSTGTTGYAWDYENRLTSVTLPGAGGTVSFSYDPFGHRIEKSSSAGASIFAYDGDDLIEETNSSGAVVARYSHGRNIDEPLAMLRAGATSFYNADGLGSVTSLANAAGSLAQTYTFDSFGKQTNSSGSITNPFQYTARESDPETGVYYYRARYYDQKIGRFISEDSFRFAAGTNFFSYVRNNPVALDDPTGHCDTNCRLSISCGPTPRTRGFSHCTVTIQNGFTYTSFDAEPSGNIWWSQLKFAPPGPGVAPGPDSFVKNVPVPCNCAQKAADDINSSNLTYNFALQNSNTAAAQMAADCGVYTDSWPKSAVGVHGVSGPWGPPANSNPWSPFNPWPLPTK